jgi:DNA-binding transcriptional regulator YiaG
VYFKDDVVMRKTQHKSGEVKITPRRLSRGDIERLEKAWAVEINLTVAKRIRKLRGESGLSQEKFAVLVGTTASVINRLEESDYDGDALAMLRQIAEALGKRVEIRIVTVKKGSK